MIKELIEGKLSRDIILGEKNDKWAQGAMHHKGKLSKILGGHPKEFSAEEIASKLSKWAGGDKEKLKSARGMLTFVANVTKDEPTKKKFEAAIKKIK